MGRICYLIGSVRKAGALKVVLDDDSPRICRVLVGSSGDIGGNSFK